MTIVDLVESMHVPEEGDQDFIDFLSNDSNESHIKLLAAIKELNWSRNFSIQVHNFLNILLYQIPHNMVELSELNRFMPNPNLEVRLLTDESFSDRIRLEGKPVLKILLKSQSLHMDQNNTYSDVVLSDLRLLFEKNSDQKSLNLPSNRNCPSPGHQIDHPIEKHKSECF